MICATLDTKAQITKCLQWEMFLVILLMEGDEKPSNSNGDKTDKTN